MHFFTPGFRSFDKNESKVSRFSLNFCHQKNKNLISFQLYSNLKLRVFNFKLCSKNKTIKIETSF